MKAGEIRALLVTGEVTFRVHIEIPVTDEKRAGVQPWLNVVVAEVEEKMRQQAYTELDLSKLNMRLLPEMTVAGGPV